MNAAKNLQGSATRSARNAAGDSRTRCADEQTSQLVRRAAEGDQRAWDQLVEEFGGLVWGIARAYRLNEADCAEVSQITWLCLVENLHRLQDGARVGAWLATTTRRQCLRQLRRSARVIPQGDDLHELVNESPAPGHALLVLERDRALWSALERLPARDRRLLRMLMADPTPSYAEISAALQMPIGSIGPTRARALERLRHEAQHQGLSDPEFG